MNTDLPESSAPMLKSLTIFERPCVVSSALLTLNQRIVNLTDVTMDMDADPPESSTPMINSDLMVVDWEDIFCGRPRYGGQDWHAMMDTDSSDPNVRKRMDTADLVYMCRTVAQDHRWSDTDDNSDADSVAELEYKIWEDACASRCRSALVHIPPGLVQNLPTDKIRNYKTNDMSDTDSIAQLNYSAWDDACVGDYQNTLGIIQNPPTCKIWNDDMDHGSDADSVAELEYKTWEDACAWRCHDVTIVDMGEVPKSAVSIPELSALSQQWPPAVLSHMGWRQKELEEMRSVAKQQFRQSRPSSCVYCGSLIKSDMYRHVTRLHLDLAQLWRCPVSWCTVWKGTPQDCMDHLRGSHNVPWEVKSATLDKFLPPWTVSRKVWSDALSAQHSGMSTDVPLFSNIHLPLVHHYRVHKRGLSHIAFRKNYLSQLRALLPLPVGLPPARVVLPDSSGSRLLCLDDSPEVLHGPTRTTRRAHRRRRPVRVEEPAVVTVPVFTIQDLLAAAGAVVLDCRPPLLPVSMDISGVYMSTGRLPATLAGMDGLLPGGEP